VNGFGRMLGCDDAVVVFMNEFIGSFPAFSLNSKA
jgi:hypothetical protein